MDSRASYYTQEGSHSASMPRNGRKEIIGKREDIARRLREEALRELRNELRHEWRERIRKLQRDK